MHENTPLRYGSAKATQLVLYGSLCLCMCLTLSLIYYDVARKTYFTYSSIGIAALVYLICAGFLVHKQYVRLASWMLVGLYTFLSFTMLLTWGIGAAAGIFATSFVIILSGTLLGSRAVLPITTFVASLLLLVQSLHTVGLATPAFHAFLAQSTLLDTLTYTVILVVISLLTWFLTSQFEKALERAQIAEAHVRRQKEALAKKLHLESARLREAQLKQIQQLYKFATLGQTVAATLHELSNHLCVLNMDIDDLEQYHKNSKAIANAKDGVSQINTMVKQIRHKLDSSGKPTIFNATAVIRRAVKDQELKFKAKGVGLSFIGDGRKSVIINGDPTALIQIMSILITNAFDACSTQPKAHVTVRLAATTTQLEVSIIDTGPGVPLPLQSQLFSPLQSTKPTGLGVGLYIARHLTETQFHGSIALKPSAEGAHFMVAINLASRP